MAESTDNLQQAEVGMTIPVKIDVWQFWSVIYHGFVHSWLVIYTVGHLICSTCNVLPDIALESEMFFCIEKFEYAAKPSQRPAMDIPNSNHVSVLKTIL